MNHILNTIGTTHSTKLQTEEGKEMGSGRRDCRQAAYSKTPRKQVCAIGKILVQDKGGAAADT